MSVDPQTFRNALSRFASGVTVVTCLDAEGGPTGLTVSAFSSLSLDPPLVLFCIGKNGRTTESFVSGEFFVINILADSQDEVSNLFAGRDAEKFSKIESTVGLGGCPVIAGCLANMECRRTAVLDGGDHWIVVGEIENVTTSDEASPLLYFGGSYRKLA
ncbi:MAG: flavin reductase family protein [Rhodospirillales bacterium]|nr:flavin reductase family protein [Rhodospirillales bacterium]MCW8862465.1 flavin reductase family protein [Rhodospirillales bacterium]MCW8952510.1 flavin reductase family protein [Rhodospirillales bacterium]MCW8971188.1 flavin reductase family protein [Rhodospirillales bacterium]MCW9001920.1 flavin reductase family protein [Rhodospirillales bacterium]